MKKELQEWQKFVDKVLVNENTLSPKNASKEKEEITLGVTLISEKDNKLFIEKDSKNTLKYRNAIITSKHPHLCRHKRTRDRTIGRIACREKPDWYYLDIQAHLSASFELVDILRW